MVSADPIADFISQLKNASMAGKRKVVVPHSKFKHEIAEVLRHQGFIYSVNKKSKKTKKILEIELCAPDSKSVISDVERVSKPSRRVYSGVRDIYPKKHQTAVFSTPAGILTAGRAKEKNVGGEELFRIW